MEAQTRVAAIGLVLHPTKLVDTSVDSVLAFARARSVRVCGDCIEHSPSAQAGENHDRLASEAAFACSAARPRSLPAPAGRPGTAQPRRALPPALGPSHPPHMQRRTKEGIHRSIHATDQLVVVRRPPGAAGHGRPGGETVRQPTAMRPSVV
ncbi:hypothetical protein ODJ79_29535 [Actinoplanes sp. KI2]|uniref:hypothetical protein n=1 Tax=Actinoplanes sp. KI2 TaxID=2983315 RepID=UPI0021D5DB5C|nr:hypothetical protein [Actinoplanes sp. KI2]MCU7727880.1 hypothetical protein [Actinoplanes sp. KI2]